MNIDDLKNPELQNKLSGASSAEELVALAKEGGLALTDDQLEAVSGGSWNDDTYEVYTVDCPNCAHKLEWDLDDDRPTMCPRCHYVFKWADESESV